MAWVAYRSPVTVVAAQLRTEHVSFVVTNDNAARFVLPHAHVKSTGTCLTNVLVSPPRGKRVTYLRHGRAAVSIVLPADTTWDSGHGTRPWQESEIVEVRAFGCNGPTTECVRDCECTKRAACAAPGCNCPKIDGVRLPIAGIAEFGEAKRDIPGRSTEGDRADAMLLSGRIVVYARAVPDLFWKRLNFGPFVPNALYVVRDIDIPGGTILATHSREGQEGVGESQNDPRWSGFVDIEFGDDDPTAMSVAAAVNTADVKVKLLGARATADGARYSDSDVVPLTLLARLIGDPNLQLIYVLLGAVVAVYKLLEWVSRRVHRGRFFDDQ